MRKVQDIDAAAVAAGIAAADLAVAAVGAAVAAETGTACLACIQVEAAQVAILGYLILAVLRSMAARSVVSRWPAPVPNSKVAVASNKDVPPPPPLRHPVVAIGEEK